MTMKKRITYERLPLEVKVTALEKENEELAQCLTEAVTLLGTMSFKTNRQVEAIEKCLDRRIKDINI
jgi:antitoxin component of RelBE/YafQ-DinJ toxin-antitoxin module